jgi:hypothetical protein
MEESQTQTLLSWGLNLFIQQEQQTKEQYISEEFVESIVVLEFVWTFFILLFVLIYRFPKKILKYY